MTSTLVNKTLGVAVDILSAIGSLSFQKYITDTNTNCVVYSCAKLRICVVGQINNKDPNTLYINFFPTTGFEGEECRDKLIELISNIIEEVSKQSKISIVYFSKTEKGTALDIFAGLIDQHYEYVGE